MSKRDPSLTLAIVILLGAVAAAIDLERIQETTLVVYTTPALRDALDGLILPAFREETGVRVEAVYLTAGSQYNRVRMSGHTPEADVFVHASPLFIEVGYEGGYFDAINPPGIGFGPGNESRAVPGGHYWFAFAWSPLVEIYDPDLGTPPDLATAELRYGLAHPRLSNNGVYTVLFFESTDPAVGQRGVQRTVVQPVNARTNVAGVADGSFDVTLGYEGVVQFFEEQGADVAYDIPLIGGRRVTTPVLFSAAIVDEHRHGTAQEFLEFLFSAKVQNGLARFHLRPMVDDAPQPKGALDLANVETITYNWTDWRTLDESLDRYEVRG